MHDIFKAHLASHVEAQRAIGMAVGEWDGLATLFELATGIADDLGAVSPDFDRPAFMAECGFPDLYSDDLE